jgi:hypothetical protein
MPMALKHQYLTLLLLLAGSNLLSVAQKPVILEFGWDYPDVRQLATSLPNMQAAPFDGICFSLQNRITEAFDTTQHPERFFEWEQLPGLPWGKYTHNYLILRGFSKHGGHWTDDRAWQKIRFNMQRLSESLRTGGLRGILFDPEYYYADSLYNPWTYSRAQYPAHNYSEMTAIVRKRGREFMEALQTSAKNFDFLSIWLTSLIDEDRKLMPLEKTRHALLIPFIEGMLLEKQPGVRIIDGNEYAYWYRKPSSFVTAAARLQNSTRELFSTAEAKALVSNILTAQTVFYDGLLARHPSFNKNVCSTDGWHWLQENLKMAIATSTSGIVWFYNERVNWWKDAVNDTLVNILSASRKGFLPGENQRARLIPSPDNLNNGKGYFYGTHPRQPMRPGEIAFTFKRNKTGDRLNMDYGLELPVLVEVYCKGVRILHKKPVARTEQYRIDKKIKGPFIFLSYYKDDREGFGYQVY